MLEKESFQTELIYAQYQTHSINVYKHLGLGLVNFHKLGFSDEI